MFIRYQYKHFPLRSQEIFVKDKQMQHNNLQKIKNNNKIEMRLLDISSIPYQLANFHVASFWSLRRHYHYLSHSLHQSKDNKSDHDLIICSGQRKSFLKHKHFLNQKI